MYFSLLSVGTNAIALRDGYAKDGVFESTFDSSRGQARTKGSQRATTVLLLYEQIRHTAAQGRRRSVLIGILSRFWGYQKLQRQSSEDTHLSSSLKAFELSKLVRYENILLIEQ